MALMSKKLEDRVVVITGATSGMALATAKLFVEEGAYIFITGPVRQEMLDKAVKEIGSNWASRVRSLPLRSFWHLMIPASLRASERFVDGGIAQV